MEIEITVQTEPVESKVNPALVFGDSMLTLKPETLYFYFYFVCWLTGIK